MKLLRYMVLNSHVPTTITVRRESKGERGRGLEKGRDHIPTKLAQAIPYPPMVMDLSVPAACLSPENTH